MSDNVPITAGSGTNVATDDVSGVHYQRIKLVNGTLDATDAIPGDSTNGLDVDVTRVQGTVAVTDNSGSLTVDATDLDIRNLAVTQDSVGLFPSASSIKNGVGSATTTGSTQVIAGTSSNYLYVTTVVVHNSSSTDTFVNLQDGSGGTTLLTLPAAAKGGSVIPLPVPLRVPTSGNGLYFAANAGVTTMYVSAVGFISTT